MSSSGGGVFLPGDPPPSTNQVLTTPTIVSPTITSAALAGTTTIGAGMTATTPTILFTASTITATGTTGTNAAAVSAAVPGLFTITGASGAGIALASGACVPGSLYILKNKMTGAFNIYSIGPTINGTTGTTAFPVTATGTAAAIVMCAVAGAWEVSFNT